MRVEAIEGVYDVVTIDELQSALMKRVRDGVNCYWLSRDIGGFPTLAILVKGDLASLSYMRADRDAGFQSVGHLVGLEGNSTSFTISANGEELVAQNDSVVPFSIALKAAGEFLADPIQPPASVEWTEL